MRRPDKIDRLIGHLYSELLDADRQSSNPTVFFRHLMRGMENFLRAEGYEKEVVHAIEFANAKVLRACMMDPGVIAEFFRERNREQLAAGKPGKARARKRG